MPDEVFNAWLAPLIEQIGWPFTSTNDSFGETRWKYLLARTSLSVWHTGSWRLANVDAKETLTDPMQEVMFRELIKSGVGHDVASGANLKDTEKRFKTCADFVRIHDTIPVPIVGVFCKGIFKILDGSHRLAALFHVKGFRSHIVPCWIFERIP